MKFTKKQIGLMALLGHTTTIEQEMCFEAFDEAYWEQRANGIACEKSFTKWLERAILWKQQKARLMLAKGTYSSVDI